ncbi:MAG: type VI secretion system baseplate subunit TssG, partial [Acetobacteraceae bacterium]|nr:type VI secretion system baseplate subunit TssG [Acetobacteraceae bacterium]
SVIATRRDRSHALHDFLDMLSHRLVALFARAGMKYRPARSAAASALAHPSRTDPVEGALLAFAGYPTPQMADRVSGDRSPLLFYSGFFSAHPRSAERLESLLSDWLGQAVRVEQFAGAWLLLRREDRTRLAQGLLPGPWSRLGVDAAIGTRAWDLQGRVLLRIGPMSRAAFEALMPDRPVLARLVSLVRAFLPPEIGFAVNPMLEPTQVAPLVLDRAAEPRPRLGWNTWLPLSAPARRRAADDARFEEVVIQHAAAAT